MNSMNVFRLALMDSTGVYWILPSLACTSRSFAITRNTGLTITSMDQCSSQSDDGRQVPLPFQVMHEFNRGWELQDIHELLREINRQFNANVCLLALRYFIS